ncbi:hypothetical protein A244_20541, partial [Pseudomonas syringae pv. actinidiae ICMP 18807]
VLTRPATQPLRQGLVGERVQRVVRRVFGVHGRFPLRMERADALFDKVQNLCSEGSGALRQVEVVAGHDL